jgi:hypothetical protein
MRAVNLYCVEIKSVAHTVNTTYAQKYIRPFSKIGRDMHQTEAESSGSAELDGS